MSGEPKTHTAGEVEIIRAMARVETLQCMMNDDFRDHKKEDDDHFGNLYEADKKILAEVKLIPERMTECSEKIKTETLQVARNEFTSKVEIETYKGTVKESMAGVRGSIKTTSIVLGVFQTILLLLLGAWLKSKGLG